MAIRVITKMVHYVKALRLGLLKLLVHTEVAENTFKLAIESSETV